MSNDHDELHNERTVPDKRALRNCWFGRPLARERPARAAPRAGRACGQRRHRVGGHRLASVPGALGPGLVTGASDDDPSGIATYSQTGAQFRYSMLWSALLTLPLTIGLQEIRDRTALATGQGLGELLRRRFGRVGTIAETV